MKAPNGNMFFVIFHGSEEFLFFFKFWIMIELTDQWKKSWTPLPRGWKLWNQSSDIERKNWRRPIISELSSRKRFTHSGQTLKVDTDTLVYWFSIWIHSVVSQPNYRLLKQFWELTCQVIFPDINIIEIAWKASNAMD